MNERSQTYINEMWNAQPPGAGHYNTYDLLQFPVVPVPKSNSESKLEAIGYKHEDFYGKSVIDLGACMGFFSFLALDHGATLVRGIEHNEKWLVLLNKWRDVHVAEFGDKISGKMVFENMDLSKLPDLGKHDLVMCHALIHWFTMQGVQSIDKCMAWLASICSGRVIFEGCWDPTERFQYHPFSDREILFSRLNPVIFIQSATRHFKNVRFIGGCSYNPKRVVIELMV